LDGIWQAKVPKNSYKLFFAKTTNAEEQVDARYKNNMGPQVRRRRHARGWSQSVIARKLQIAGFNISRSRVSKIGVPQFSAQTL
jgi:ribosome-binding protein aMBF1 (putative translation factor)